VHELGMAVWVLLRRACRAVGRAGMRGCSHGPVLLVDALVESSMGTSKVASGIVGRGASAEAEAEGIDSPDLLWCRIGSPCASSEAARVASMGQ
jgi:hypothetical protein